MQVKKRTLTQEGAIRGLKVFTGVIMICFALAFTLRETVTLTFLRTAYGIYPSSLTVAFVAGGMLAFFNSSPKVFLVATLPLMVYALASFPIVTDRPIAQPLPFISTFGFWTLANGIAWIEALPRKRTIVQAGVIDGLR